MSRVPAFLRKTDKALAKPSTPNPSKKKVTISIGEPDADEMAGGNVECPECGCSFVPGEQGEEDE